VPAPPIPNSYWVEPGRLLAGEYPGSMSRAEALNRVQALLRAGVNSFIDLTEARELPPYDVLLPRDGQAPVLHQRMPIPDHGLPDSPQVMAEILDAIAAQIAAGRCVYVHCRAGIGRTGMTIGCHLTRGGLDNEAALDRLQTLWQQCARSASWPSVPETQEQIDFLRGWREPARGAAPTPMQPAVLAPASHAQRVEGALLGLAVGEALAIAKSNGQLGLGNTIAIPDALPTGADTATTQAVAASLRAFGHRAEDQLQRYNEFIRSGQHAQSGVAAANLSPELKRAVAAWQWSRKPNAGTHDPKNLDPHSLARSLAVALYQRADAAAAGDLAVEVSRTTQQSPVVLDAVRFWTALLADALAGIDKSELLGLQGPAMQAVRQRALRKELHKLLGGSWSTFPAHDNGAPTLLARALLALQGTENFEQGIRKLLDSPAMQNVNAATAGSLYGALAGACYGIAAIPESWQRALPQAQALRDLAREFAG